MRLVTLTMDIAAQVPELDDFVLASERADFDPRLEDIAYAVEKEIEMFVPTIVVKGQRVGKVTRVACVRKSEQ